MAKAIALGAPRHFVPPRLVAHIQVMDMTDAIESGTLSLRPRRSSGIPDSTTRSLMFPTISLRSTLPLAFTCRRERNARL
ncbi:hypothetical protein EYF80_048261 [Liparis tanakae]|uniref:Uncharacterized protein n=1 Tax=Liparis tanakae TaxID=230148 RepID=A0A4Z2FLE6_9TELE|nr:hypothetical protein EYF80_048261 [Liparis tanakae]